MGNHPSLSAQFQRNENRAKLRADGGRFFQVIEQHRSSGKSEKMSKHSERRLCRERQTVIAERISHVNRIKGLPFAQGIGDYAPLR